MVNKTWYPTEYHVRHLKCHIHNNYLNETFYRAKSSSIFLDRASPRKSCAIIFPSLSIYTSVEFRLPGNAGLSGNRTCSTSKRGASSTRFLDGIHPRFFLRIQRDTENLQSLIVIFLVNLLHVRHLRHTRPAPRGPEIQ